MATDYAHLGLWNEAGIALGDHPNLVMEADVIEPDVRECWINLYRSSENTHGFTVGSKTGAEADMLPVACATPTAATSRPSGERRPEQRHPLYLQYMQPVYLYGLPSINHLITRYTMTLHQHMVRARLHAELNDARTRERAAIESERLAAEHQDDPVWVKVYADAAAHPSRSCCTHPHDGA